MDSRVAVVFAAFVLCLVASERETHRLVKVQFGVEVAQDVVHDKDQNTVTVTVTQTPDLKHLKPTVNFHDFDTKYVAFKDIDGGVCLITLAPIPYPTPTLYRMGKTNATLAFTATYDSSPLSSDEVENIAGGKIRDFCQDYKAFRMYLTPTSETHIRKRSVRSLTAAPCWFMCGKCLVSGDQLRV